MLNNGKRQQNNQVFLFNFILVLVFSASMTVNRTYTMVNSSVSVSTVPILPSDCYGGKLASNLLDSCQNAVISTTFYKIMFIV